MNVENLRAWFLQRARDLPWRIAPSPYQVWISEVMLQQTQVVSVIPYFERWMHQFPTIQMLATANIDDVLKIWEGLGYYSRARNLHLAARKIVDEYGGELPKEENQLLKIPGLGPYTVGAIRNFAFKEKAAAVDGNVLRVITRHEGILTSIDEGKTQRQIKQIVFDYLPNEAPWEISEAFIELGAIVCRPKPKCHECPIKTSCKAFTEEKTHLLPVRKARRVVEVIHRVVFVIAYRDYVLISKKMDGKIMSHLCQFPFFALQDIQTVKEPIFEFVLNKISLKMTFVQELSTQEHSFTSFKAHLYPFLFAAQSPEPLDGFEWMHLQELEKMAFSSGHKRILQNFISAR